MKNLKKISGVLFTLVGFILLYASVKKVGFDQIVIIFKELGWELFFVLLIPLTWTFFHTLGWYLVIEETGLHVSVWQLFKIKLVGEAINNVTPVSFMGGDSLRLFLMQKKAPGALSAASIVLDRTIISLAVVPFLMIGLLAAGLTLDLPVAWKWSFPLLTALIGILIWFFIHHQKKGLFDFLSKVLSKLGFKKHLSEHIQQKFDEIDERIGTFYKKNPKRFTVVLLCHLTARLCGVFEIYLIACILNIPLTLIGALLLASLTILVNMVFVFIPGSLGVLEGAYGALFHLMKLEPAYGVGIQLVRRVRTIIWILIGLLFLLPPFQSRQVEKGDLISSK